MKNFESKFVSANRLLPFLDNPESSGFDCSRMKKSYTKPSTISNFVKNNASVVINPQQNKTIEKGSSSINMSMTMGRDSNQQPSTIIAKKIFRDSGSGESNLICGSIPEKAARIGISMAEEDASLLINKPFAAKDFKNGKVEEPEFRYAFLSKPKLQVNETENEIIKNGGPRDFLMTPLERRAHNEQEVKSEKAARILHKARAIAARREYLMKKRFPYGIVGVDGPATSLTDVYKDQQDHDQRLRQARQQTAQTRLEKLTSKTCSAERLGYELLSHVHDRPPSVQDKKIFQSKIRSGKYENTYDSLFKKEKYLFDFERAKMLNDRERNGKEYNITSPAIKLPNTDWSTLDLPEETKTFELNRGTGLEIGRQLSSILDVIDPLLAGEKPTSLQVWKLYLRNLFSPLTVALIVLIISRSVDRVLYTRLTIDYIHFIWFLANVLSSIAFLFVSWPIVWYKMSFTKDVTVEMRAFPQYKFAIMAFLDMMFSFLSTFPQPHLGGSICNVMNQIVLPFNMVGSILFLGTRYHKAHWVGAVLAIYGVLVNLMPFFEGKASSEAQSNPYYDPSFGWISLNGVSFIFMAMSNIYKEIALKDYDLDVWYSNAWIGLWQLLLGFLTMWTINIQVFTDPNPPISFSQFGPYLYNAMTCFFGQPSKDVTSDAIYPCNESVGVVFLLYIIFNLVFNMLMLYTFKSGSSVLFVISSAVALPLSDILYTSSFIAGSATQPFTIYDGFALFVLVLSMLIYYSEKEERVVVSDSPKHSKKFVPQTPMLDGAASERAHKNKKEGGGRVGKLKREDTV